MKKLFCFILFFATHGFSQAQWAIGPASNPSFEGASITNKNDDLLSIHCMVDTLQCTWGFAIKEGCEEGSTYPVLVNAADGTATHQIKCRGSFVSSGTKYHTYEFIETSAITSAVSGGGIFGFVFWTNRGECVVYRFNVDGYTGASKQLYAGLARKRAVFNKNSEQPSRERL